jgi:hypothetical protein
MIPDTRIFLGIIWFIIAMIYISVRLISNLGIGLTGWIGFLAMFTAGVSSILEGLSTRKNRDQ